MQIFGKIVWKVFEISHFWGVFCICISGTAPGPSPSLKVGLLREKANAHLGAEWRA